MRAAHVATQISIHLLRRITQSRSLLDIPTWCHTARPWINAIKLNDYGLEDPHMAILYALNNLHNWRGDEARRLKAELLSCVEAEEGGLCDMAAGRERGVQSSPVGAEGSRLGSQAEGREQAHPNEPHANEGDSGTDSARVGTTLSPGTGKEADHD
jgi:hypothetical protein